MPNIRKEFTYNIPNEYYSDDFSEGKTGTFVYEGPEYLTIEIDKETGKELGWCLYTPEEHERPVAEDCMRMTIDCKDNPLVCEIVNDQGKDSDREFYETREWLVLYEGPDDTWGKVEIPAVMHPRDIYDEFNVSFDFETQEFVLPVRTWEYMDKVKVDAVTWDHFRALRNQALQAADGVTDQSMPEEILNAWEEYRQKLRDAPEILKDVPPFFAAQLLPDEPDFSPGADAADIFADIMIQDDPDKAV